MDTTSNGISRVLHLLSEAPEVQERLRGEIMEAYEKWGDHDPTYDELNALPFLDAVCKETLRV
jgi:cytochrome P450